MADDVSGLIWITRAQQAPSPRARVDTELARERIASDTLRYQQAVDRQRIAVRIAQLEAAQRTIACLRRRLRGDAATFEVAGGDAT